MKLLLLLSVLFSLSVSAQLQSLQIIGDTLFSVNPQTGSKTAIARLPQPSISPSYGALGSGTAYTLTNSSAAVDMGTTDPVITIAVAGTYYLVATVKTDYVGATIAAMRTVTYKIRRTNNTATDLATTSFMTPVTTLLTSTAQYSSVAVMYTAAEGDVITIYGDMSVLPTIGTVQTSEARIFALKLQ